MAEPVPTHEDAQIVLELYDLRREEVMREAREFMGEFIREEIRPAAEAGEIDMEWFEDKLPSDSRENAYFRQVSTYWNMVGALVKTGTLHHEVLFESTHAFHRTWKGIEPVVQKLREEWDTEMLANLEWLSEKYEDYREQHSEG